MTDAARLEHVIRLQMREIDDLRTKYNALVEAVQDKFGAHGALIVTYSDPTKPDSIRVKAAAAAIPYEKAKVGGPPQQVAHLHLFTRLERLRTQKAELIEAGPIEGPDPA